MQWELAAIVTQQRVLSPDGLLIQVPGTGSVNTGAYTASSFNFMPYIVGLSRIVFLEDTHDVVILDSVILQFSTLKVKSTENTNISEQ